MRVVWCVNGMEHFGHVLADALGWPLMVGCPTGTVDVALIVGLYDAPHYHATMDCTKAAKKRIIYFCGSDVMMLSMPDILPDATYLCETEAIRQELLAKGVVVDGVSVFPTARHLGVTPYPKKKAVAFYKGNCALKYGSAYISDLQEIFPEVDFIVYSLGHFSDEDMQQLSNDVSVYLRLPEHDGGACSAREFLEAGRRVVCTAPLPFAHQVSREDPVGIIRAVDKALRQPEPDTEAAEFYARDNSAERWKADFSRITGESC